MKFAVIVFPGSKCDADMLWAVREIMGADAEFVRHDESSLEGFDGVLLPGGFSYGDYLRCGAIARFSTIMEEVIRFAEEGKPVFGTCNGADEIIYLPVAHGEGNYFCDEETLQELKKNNQIAFTYNDNINGSVENIAGITNKAGNVLGMMPHPERAVEDLLGSEDGKRFFASILKNFGKVTV